MANQIPFHKTYIPDRFLTTLSELLQRGNLEGGGKTGRECELFLKNSLQRDVLLTSSCTSALEGAVFLCDIKDNDEVIIPSYTFTSSASAITRAGGIPVFVDVDPETLCLDLDQVEQAITSKTKAIMAVHYAGFSCDMDRLINIAKIHNLKVIEDAAQALFCTYKDRPLGTFGDFGCISFHDSKVFSAGEGGALVINTPEFKNKAAIWRDKGTNRQDFLSGQVNKYGWVGPGTNAYMDEMSAGLLLSQLHEKDKILKQRRALFEIYQSALSKLIEYGVRLHTPPLYNAVNAHFFALVFPERNQATKFIDYLETLGIQATQHYPPLHLSDYVKGCKAIPKADLPNSAHISNCIVRLPLYTDMNQDDQKYVIDTVLSFWEKTQKTGTA